MPALSPNIVTNRCQFQPIEHSRAAVPMQACREGGSRTCGHTQRGASQYGIPLLTGQPSRLAGPFLPCPSGQQPVRRLYSRLGSVRLAVILVAALLVCLARVHTEHVLSLLLWGCCRGSPIPETEQVFQDTEVIRETPGANGGLAFFRDSSRFIQFTDERFAAQTRAMVEVDDTRGGCLQRRAITKFASKVGHVVN